MTKALIRFFVLTLGLIVFPSCVRKYEYEYAKPVYRDDSASVELEPSSEPMDGFRITEKKAWVFETQLKDLSAVECFRFLDQNQVQYQKVARVEAPNVENSVFLSGKINGIEFSSIGNRKNQIMDCKIVSALLIWTKTLKKRGVQRVNYFSVYRPGARVRGTRKISGHSIALAFDLKSIVVSCSELDGGCDSNGTLVSVLTDWGNRTRGVHPCEVSRDETSKAELLRSVVCEAVKSNLFQVVLTPHYDRAHQNHVHLEIKPNTDWTYVR